MLSRPMTGIPFGASCANCEFHFQIPKEQLYEIWSLNPKGDVYETLLIRGAIAPSKDQSIMRSEFQ
jgi:hypothetical protein